MRPLAIELAGFLAIGIPIAFLSGLRFFFNAFGFLGVKFSFFFFVFVFFGHFLLPFLFLSCFRLQLQPRDALDDIWLVWLLLARLSFMTLRPLWPRLACFGGEIWDMTWA
jgi:hypothetical protein